MTNLVAKVKCSRCLGTGIDDNVIPNVLCVPCSGTGYVQSEVIDTTEIMDLLDWIKKHIKKIEKKLDIEEE